MKDLIQAAEEAIALLNNIAESEGGPMAMPFPEAEKLREEIDRVEIDGVKL